MTIFYDTAPKFWAAGLAAIPLRINHKAPIPTKWQRFSQEIISPELREQWLHRYPANNIGVVAGPMSGVVFLDNDTSDPQVTAMLDAILPPSPWQRVGKKGFVRAYKYDGANGKSWQIHRENGEVVVELLSSLRQCVMPPSIHPETMLPYQANAELHELDVLTRLMCLPPDLEKILVSALGELGIRAAPKTRVKVSAPVVMGGRDIAMIRVAGHFADCVVKGEVNFVDVREQMYGWYESRVEKVLGDELDIDKGVAKIAEFMIRDVCQKNKSLPEGWDFGISDEEREALGFGVFGDAHKQYTYEEIHRWMLMEMMVHEPASEGARAVLSGCLDKIVRSNCDAASIDQLLNYARKMTGFKDVRLETLRKTITTRSRSGIKGDSHREIGDALIAELNAETLHRYWGGMFYSWEGTQWLPVPKEELATRVGQQFGDLPLGKRQSDHMAVVRYMAGVMKVETLNTSGCEGINFKNGYLVAVLGKGMVLKPHDERYGATYQLAYNYDPSRSGDFKRFDRFLKDCWGEDEDYLEKVKALQEAMAVTLLGKGPTFQRAICLHGVPNTGKSVILKLVQKLLPLEAQCAIPPERWNERFDTSGLVSKLLNVCGELDEKKRINGKAFKQIVCGETIRMERKNQDGFDYEPRAIHWFASNHLPLSTDSSEGFTRRWMLLHFSKIVKSVDVILDLAEVIAREEGEAIIAWVVELAAEMAKASFQSSWTLPVSHHSLMRDMQSQNNDVLQFLRDSGRVMVAQAVMDSPVGIGEDTLYSAYCIYVYEVAGVRPAKLVTFRQRMRELGSAMGFTSREVMDNTGTRYLEYVNLTLVKSGPGKSQRS